MLRRITRLIAGLLAAGLLLALAPSASAAATYDITQVGDASWVGVTDANGRELSGQTTASDGLQVTATVRLRIDDIGALREGDTVLVKATAASGSHFEPGLFSRATLPPSLLDRRGNTVFTVSNADGDSTILKLIRTGTTALGSYSCDLAATNKLWRRTPESKTSTWRIGSSSAYTFASWPLANTPCASNSNGEWVPQVQGNSIEVDQWFRNCGTMRSIMDGPDTSGIRTESQVGWARIIPESGRITSLDVFNSSTFILKAVDGRTPGSLDARTSILRPSWKSDVDISTYDKAVANLPVGSVAVMEREDGSWDIAYNIGSRLPGLANSLKMPDSSDPATLELQRNTGNIWQVAAIPFYVRFRDESVPNRVSVETRGTEYAYRSRTLTTKTIDPAIGQGQSAIRYDPNGGDGDAFRKVGDSGTTVTAAEAGIFLRKGYAFAGWNTRPDGTGKSFTDKQTVADLLTHENAVGTLYAQWTPTPPVITVVFHSNDGGADETVKRVWASNNLDMKAIGLPDGWTKKGFVFHGWNLAADGSGVEYKAGESLYGRMTTATVDLYADWAGLSSTLPQAGGSTKAPAYGAGLALMVLGAGAWLSAGRRRRMA